MIPMPAARPDPLIDEVRQRRREAFAACGDDPARFLAEIRRIQAEHPDKILHRPKGPLPHLTRRPATAP